MTRVDAATVNTDWANRGDGKYLAWVAGFADIIFVQEGKDTDLHKAAPDGFGALQKGALGSPEAGSAILFRKALLTPSNFRLELGVEASIKGRKLHDLQDRHIAIADFQVQGGGVFTGISCHEPPARYSGLQPFMSHNIAQQVRAAKHKVILGTDANMPHAKFGTAVGLKTYGEGIVCLASNMKVDNVMVRPWGEHKGYTDHPCVSGHIDV